MPLMARIHTHYDNLKVARNAPPEVIRAAYKTLSQKYHPDRNGNSENAIRIIQIINIAYEVLSDPRKRQEHDEWITRTEAESERTQEMQKSDFSEVHSSQRGWMKVRQRTSHRGYSTTHRKGSGLSRTIYRMLTALDHFSRKLFRKI